MKKNINLIKKIITSARNKIKLSEIQKGIDLMSSLKDIEIVEYEIELNLLSANLNEANRSYYLGLEEKSKEINRITYALLKIIENVENKYIKEKNVENETFHLVDASLDLVDSNYSDFGEIIKIDEKKGGSRYSFPTIDFRFQNLSDNHLMLYKFGIEIIDKRIDNRPEFDFYLELVDEDNQPIDRWERRKKLLKFYVESRGWGSLFNCKFKFKEPELISVFGEKQMECNLEILSKEVEDLIILDSEKTTSKLDENLRPEIILRERGIEKIEVEWECEDETGQKYTGSSELKSKHGDGFYLNIGSSSFTLKAYTNLANMEESQVTYISLLDIDSNVTKKEYPITHKITPWDIERFHIMIGATKSCFITVRFTFDIHRIGTVKSKDFIINIINPKNSYLSKEYRDGDYHMRDEIQPSYPDNWEGKEDLVESNRSYNHSNKFPFKPIRGRGRYYDY